MNVLLIFEMIPEKTTIALLTPDDLERGKLSLDQLRRVAGKVQNSDDLDEEQSDILGAISDNITGSGHWARHSIDLEEPPEVMNPVTVIWCGFVL